jgi:AcrR family transcriptional regulator
MKSPHASRTPPPSRSLRPSRSDGQVTRDQILQTAGMVFAERGYAHATSKAICERAGTNVAAVNYHFGSRDGLYEAVLIEAHRQLIDMDDLLAISSAPGDARERLGSVLTQIVGMATESGGWAFRVLVREMMSPSPAMPALAAKAVAPKAEIMMRLIAEFGGLAPSDPAVQRCAFMCVVPTMLIAVAPPALKTNVFPALMQDPDALLDALKAFCFAGIEAVARQSRKPRSAAKAPAAAQGTRRRAK